jgi:hypothetical protein
MGTMCLKRREDAGHSPCWVFAHGVAGMPRRETRLRCGVSVETTCIQLGFSPLISERWKRSTTTARLHACCVTLLPEAS